MIAILILAALAAFAVLVTVAVLVMGYGGQLAGLKPTTLRWTCQPTVW